MKVVRSSRRIRQDFLDFFRSKQHTLVPSSSLMPDAPNLLFTNAGMNQFVPIFLAQRAADVDRWGGAQPGLPTRAADTQKCIRAGGKHNDLEDVGFDTYHHTFFEMLGNWSFGDYFKKEAIEWAWELITEVWRFPKERLYATVYQPGPGDPAAFDQEAYDHWARLFVAAGLDPKVHIRTGGKKDNFWMMGETGPCGPCSELHVDLTPAGDTRGALVNAGDARCMEIWNLVFIQFNAGADGTFSPLPARHVDTGMGFERVTSILQCTREFTDFSGVISNYETDVFRPIFDAVEKMSGKRYGSSLPPADLSTINEQQSTDVAFRVVADHFRTLGFAIADGIQPGNTDRNYVLRRILRRAVRYGRSLGFKEPFFYRLVDVLAETMGPVFPEIQTRRDHVEETIRVEEEAFNRTLDRGTLFFDAAVEELNAARQAVLQIPPKLKQIEAELNGASDAFPVKRSQIDSWGADFAGFLTGVNLVPTDRNQVDGIVGKGLWGIRSKFVRRLHDLILPGSQYFVALLQGGDSSHEFEKVRLKILDLLQPIKSDFQELLAESRCIPGFVAFTLYDTYGFPLDLTELMARERGLTVEVAEFERLMEEQRTRGRAALKREVIAVSRIETVVPTRFVGYETLGVEGKVLEVVRVQERSAVICDVSPFYAEMGGQVGDMGELAQGGATWRVTNTQKSGEAWLHLVAEEVAPTVGAAVELRVDGARRAAIQRHHTVTHLLHWALHEVLGPEVSQKGSYVGPEKLTFDFNSAALTPEQLTEIERLVNERVLENAPVSWTEVDFTEIRGRREIMQFFGEKYGDRVRVVQIGGAPAALDGYSMELCGGTHSRATGEIGLFRISAEGAIAAGIRRIEAIAGLAAYRKANEDLGLIRSLASKVNAPVGELEKKIESLLTQQRELERELKGLAQKQAAESAAGLLSRVRSLGGIPALIEEIAQADGETLQAMANALKGRFEGVLVLGGVAEGAVSLVVSVGAGFVGKVHAGKIIQQIAPLVGGKGGGRTDNARGGGKQVEGLGAALAKAAELVAAAH
jgi:alanyl-tRNA synthetase